MEFHHTGLFTPEEGATDNHWTGGWVGPTDSMHAVEKRSSSFSGGISSTVGKSTACSTARDIEAHERCLMVVFENDFLQFENREFSVQDQFSSLLRFAIYNKN
jgi:hypothetical protein